MLTLVVVEHQVDPGFVVAVGRAASCLELFEMSRRKVREHPECVHEVEGRIVQRKCCSFR